VTHCATLPTTHRWRRPCHSLMRRTARGSRRSPRHRGHYRVAAAVVVIVAVLTGTAVVVARDGSGDRVRVAAPGVEAREVRPDQLTQADADLVVFLRVTATDDEVAAVRAQLDASPDVAHYAFVDHQAAWNEFRDLFHSCDPELPQSVRPEELPVSFRVTTASEDAKSRLLPALQSLAGVETVDTAPAATTATAGAPCPDQGTGLVAPEPSTVPPSTVPPTLPAAGDPPADPTTARDAVIAAFTQAWNGSNSVDERRAAMQDSEQLRSQLDQARNGNEASIASMSATVDEVTFVGPDRAAVIFHLTIGGASYQTQVGYAVLDGGTWKVSRATVCGVLTMAGVTC